MVYGLFFSVFTSTDIDTEVIQNDDRLDIIFLNVPHGEVTLLSNEKEEHVLVNTASAKSQKALQKQLTNLEIETLDKIIITNQEEAYTGNLYYLLKHYQVKEIIIPEQMDLKHNPRANVQKWSHNKVFPIWEYVSIQALDETEDGKISFLMLYRDESVLFLNNKDTEIEKKILNKVEDIDILKIAEFGSGNSPSEDFLLKSDPYLSIIFRSESHPVNEKLIERLHETWIDVYFLKQSGSVFVRLSKDDYEILTGNYSVSS